MTATIIELIICHTCQTKGKQMVYTVWEGFVYCDSCWREYLELMGDLMNQSGIK